MSRDGSGNYSLPLPPVVTGTIIEATWANTTLDDIKTALTDSLSRSGSGNMSAQLKLVDGGAAIPSVAWASEANSGLYRAQAYDIRMAINGVDKFRWSDANGVQVFDTTWKSILTYPTGVVGDETFRYDSGTSEWVATTQLTVSSTGVVTTGGNLVCKGSTFTLGDGTSAIFLNYDSGLADPQPYTQINPSYWRNDIGGDAIFYQLSAEDVVMWQLDTRTNTVSHLGGDIIGVQDFTCSRNILSTGGNITASGGSISAVGSVTGTAGLATGSNLRFSTDIADPSPSSQSYIYTKDNGGESELWYFGGSTAAAVQISPQNGTFTPTVVDSSLSAGEGQTYSAQVGHYTKIGNLVWFNLIINLSGLGTLTTSQGVRIGGLPFASSATTGAGQGTFPVYATGLSTTAGQTIQANLIQAGSQHLELVWWDATSGCTPVLFTDIGTGSLPWFFQVTGTYRID